ncbi:MAG: AAA family ATPase [Proteobacteria bacterium]|nr:AAA family ATPase [Actinomycetota bacterium]MBU4219932.1 AAA family ATPase [Actinomycetota bacterium]MBU4288018.1 AAA family ATPase [Pseudomonadota bacterium]
MYTKHFDLNKLPFENVPDPMFFFDEGNYARVRNRIRESLRAGRGLMVVTGPIGSGKTTLSQMIKLDFSSDIRFIWMAEPLASSTDLFLFVAQELGLKPSTSERTFVIRDIRNALLKINSEGSKCLVIIDESHLMSDDTINGIRLLNNLEEGSTKLIQILLLGQEELIATINRPEMEPFKQRIATLEILGRMNGDRIRKYISHRIEVAGGQPSIFSDTGWEAVVLAFGSGSVPRVINLLCDRSLNSAFEKEKTTVDVDDVYEAAEGIGLTKEVFHYKIALKQKENNQHVQSAGENDSIKEAATLSEPTQKESETGVSIYDTDQKGLKIPILFLVLSTASLILSIFFYYQKSGPP